MPRRNYDFDDDDRRPRRRRPKKQDSSPVLVLAVAGGVLLLLAVVGGVAGYVVLRNQAPRDDDFAADTPVAPANPVFPAAPVNDLQQLQGRWECTFRDPAGQVTMRKVKEINGTTELATWYRPDGSVFRANRVEFQLVARGPNKVFRYFNGRVADGPGVGQPFPSGEYVYTLTGDTWTEFEPTGGVIVWTRRR